MFFSKIEICGCQELMDWLKYNSFTSYTVHQLLWDLFPKDPDAKRTFLYREEQNSNTRLPMFYVVSADKPIHENSFLRIVGVKDYSPQVYVGQQLRFTSRINPVVSRMIKDRKRSQKHDVWADAKKRGKAAGLFGVDLSGFVEQESKTWLVSRAEKSGFALKEDRVVLEGYQSHCFRKAARGREIKYGSLDFKGVLSVTDAELFKETLFYGIGRSKAFGCGLMMVKSG
jgi:CRISPR system Cascade subunit CasE